MILAISKIRDHLLTTEKILWEGKSDPKAHSITRAKIVYVIITALIGVILVGISLAILIPKFITQNIQPENYGYFIFLIAGLGLIGLSLLIKYTDPKDFEYLITNQRVIIYPNPYGKGPRIINLYEVNGPIKMNYDKASDTGSIYIPTPRWNDIITSGAVLDYEKKYMKAWAGPDIKNIKDPYRVQRIIQEAMDYGKRTKWKQDKDSIFH